MNTLIFVSLIQILSLCDNYLKKWYFSSVITKKSAFQYFLRKKENAIHLLSSLKVKISLKLTLISMIHRHSNFSFPWPTLDFFLSSKWQLLITLIFRSLSCLVKVIFSLFYKLSSCVSEDKIIIIFHEDSL